MKIQIFKKTNEPRLIKLDLPVRGKDVKTIKIDRSGIRKVIKRVDEVKQKDVKFNKPINNQKVIGSNQAVSKPRNIVRITKKIDKNENYFKIEQLKDVGKGRILVMVACGPSILEVDFTRLLGFKNIDTMAINKPITSIWPTKYWAFCDHSQYERNKQAFENYNGILINSSVVRARKNNQVLIMVKHGIGVSKNLHEGYIIGKSSVYANMQVALWMNYDKIFIFGCDMTEVVIDGKKMLHHYGINPDVQYQKRLEKFKVEAQNYDNMASRLSGEKREKIYFCSSYNPFEFVNKFNKVDHKKAIDMIRQLS